jgi:D-glycero-D-manno-heptose 1,7-bisphosphate phosphatase
MIKQAVILVGGLGTRLGALTSETPKPLLPVAGRPFLTVLLDELARQHIGEILLLAGFRSEKIEALAKDRPGLTVMAEPAPLGTAGALKHAIDALADRFFLLNGDSLFDINLWDLALAYRGAATLALRQNPDVSRYGPAELEGDRITAFSPRSEVGGAGLINGGVGVFSKSVLDLVPSQRPWSLEQDVYPALARSDRLYGRVYDRPFLDIGVPDDFARAQTWVPQVLRRGAVIFDRDGVLNKDVGYAHRPDQIVWIEGAIAAIKAINDSGLLALIATNQSGVAHGYYAEADVVALHAWMNASLMAQGAHIDGFAYSPYHPEAKLDAYRRPSDCRKPGPGMVLHLIEKFNLDPARCVMIGDRNSDVAAAEAAGIEGVLFEGGDLYSRLQPWIGRLSAG